MTERGQTPAAPTAGAFGLIAILAAIRDPADVADAYRSAMRKAYWDEDDIPLVTALAYGGVAHLLSVAETAEDEKAMVARYAAKGLMYDLASFTWPGWDKPGVEISPNDAAGGLAAARMNLTMAIELERGDLAESRAHWLLGAHLLTAGFHDEASDAFAAAAAAAELARAPLEADLARAFGALNDLDAHPGNGDDGLQRALADLSRHPESDAFVEQVTTARQVLGR